MIGNSWVLDALGEELLKDAKALAATYWVHRSLGEVPPDLEGDGLKFTADTLELAAIDTLSRFDADVERESEDSARAICECAFEIMRVVPRAPEAVEELERLLKTAAVGILGDRGPDVKRFLQIAEWPVTAISDKNWGETAKVTVYECWLKLIRKDGWSDLDSVLTSVASLRELQAQFENDYLTGLETDARQAAWELVAIYHVAKAAEIVATFCSQGSVDGRYDVAQQIEAQFDRAFTACARAELVLLEPVLRLVSGAANQLIRNSIWSVTRAVNSRVTKFVQAITAREHRRPIFDVLPPQRKILREQGLLGSSHRSVVVNLPTSSGKTFISMFRILQALNQFDYEKGWVAYVAPTKALVNQIASRLRADFSPLGVVVEKVSPALEVDTLESDLLNNKNGDGQFRVLISTPEKLDLLLRSGWEKEIGRPLTLVVVDEAHNIAQAERGIRLELLLATINRECRYAQFLLLTPFIPNAEDIAKWLDPTSFKDIELSVDWKPNDRAIGIVRPYKGQKAGHFVSKFKTVHTSKSTLEIPEAIQVAAGKPLGLTWSGVSTNSGACAASTALAFRDRGPTIVLANRVDHVWSIARKFLHDDAGASVANDDISLVQRFIADELGQDFELINMLGKGVGVHHSGISDELRSLMEWLLESQNINVLVATTTIAQGVNFPISSVIMASHQYPYGVDMPPEDFWNLAGRVGRADQENIGIVALVANGDEKERILESFISRNVDALNSCLLSMIDKAFAVGHGLSLHKLFFLKEWSSFLQYIAHTYRQVGLHDKFVIEIEQILRGSYGYQELRRKTPETAAQLLSATRSYVERLRGKPLSLVDSTGFSWESVSITLENINQKRIRADVWDPSTLFSTGNTNLQRIMGVLLDIPELRGDLAQVTGGSSPNGNLLARMIKDWVAGATISDMAREYFSGDAADEDWTAAVSSCAKSVYGKLIQTSAWGLGAIQAMTLEKELESMDENERREIKNLPSQVLYGVRSSNAVALRLMGVPRRAAEPLAAAWGGQIGGGALQQARQLLASGNGLWAQALGDKGADYKRVWSILEGIR